MSPADSRMDAAEVLRWLVACGVVVLGVTADGTESGWLTVYLHGLAGNQQQERAFDLLVALPGVVEVRVGEQTPFILHVSQRREDPA